MEQKKMNNKGFSLVELIIVIAIMAILVGVLAPQFVKYIEKSRQATDMQNVQLYKTAIEAYVADTGSDTNCKITVTGGANGTVAIESAILYSDSKKDGIQGVAASTKLKSSTWPTQTYTYSMATGWGTPGACKNTAAPTYDIADVFK